MNQLPLLVVREGHLATVTLNRPEKLNPLDWSTIKALLEVVESLEREPAVRTVVLTGAGRAFCAGGDLAGYVKLYAAPDQFQAFLDDFHRLLDRIERSNRIYIAAINGDCAAGGLELLLACDLVLMGRQARIGDAHLNFGQLPGAGGSQRLPRAIGVLRAKHLMLTGAFVSAGEALALGLVSEVVDDEQLMPRAVELAQALARRSASGVRGMKHLVNEGMRLDREAALRFEIDYVHRYATTDPDAIEGLNAFAQKRKPVYRLP